MKKTVGILATLLFVLLLYFIFSSPEKPSPAVETVRVEKNSKQPAQAIESRLNAVRTKASAGDAAEKIQGASETKVLHENSDFAKGELQNVVVSNGLQLGNEASYVPRLKPFRVFGTYVSPEQSAPAFGSFVPSLAAKIPENSALTLEIRTRPALGDWSVWHEVEDSERDKPVMLEEPATFWQYRLTFFANDPANGPKVNNVSIATRAVASAEPNFSANNAQ